MEEQRPVARANRHHDFRVLLRLRSFRRTAGILLVVFLGAIASVGLISLRAEPPAQLMAWTAPPEREAKPAISAAVLQSVEAAVRAEMERGAFPGATMAVGRRDRMLWSTGMGRIQWDTTSAPADPDSTLYDLASLSKVVATATAVMLLVEDGRMSLEDPVQKFLPGFQGRWKKDVRIKHLLTHSSGLPEGTVLRGDSPAEVLRRLQRTLVYLPPGTRYEYSDIGYVILWAAAERAAGEPLPALLKRRVYAPLGMKSTGFLPGPDCTLCAPTLYLVESKIPYRGRPSDITARKLGGIAGNAGLFSTAHDLARFAAMVTNGGELDGVRIFRPETVALFNRLPAPGDPPRPHGWQLFCMSDTLPEAPPCREPYAFGHTGYAGASLYIDPEEGNWVVLLTNRTYLPRAESRMPALRRNIFRMVANPVD